jgi:hypothetical protein
LSFKLRESCRVGNGAWFDGDLGVFWENPYKRVYDICHKQVYLTKKGKGNPPLLNVSTLFHCRFTQPTNPPKPFMVSKEETKMNTKKMIAIITIVLVAAALTTASAIAFFGTPKAATTATTYTNYPNA